MNIRFIILSAPLFLWCLQANAQFLVSGNVQHLGSQMVYFKYLNDSLQKQTDSAFAMEGSFMFRGKINEPTFGLIRSADGKLETEFFFEKGTTMLAGDVSAGRTCNATGGAATRQFAEYQEMDAPFMFLRDALAAKLYPLRAAGDTLIADSINNIFTNVQYESKLAEREFLLSHPNSPVSMYILSWLYVHPGTWAKGDGLLALMTEENQQSKYALYRQKVIEKLRRLEPGRPVVAFTQTDAYGNTFSTDELKGKYYLIDFWASWCAPCRKENPTLRKLYNKYRSKGFEIVGVSLDTNRDKWVEAISKDQLPWIHVSDLNGWQNEVARLYEINLIPTSFLIDAKGNIVAHSLRGDELAKKLMEIYGK